MSTLREQMIQDMHLRGFSPSTQQAYLSAVAGLANHYHLSPDKICSQKLRDYILFLINDRKFAWASVNLKVSALRFFYTNILQRKNLLLAIPTRKTPRRLPQVFNRNELLRLFASVDNQKHRTILITTYAAGLRVSEVIRLKLTDIDSNRMMIRVQNGKRNKDRYTILSPRLLSELRSYWRACHPTIWLFPRENSTHHLTRETPHLIFRKALKKAKIAKELTFHSLRHTFATNLLEADVDIRTIQILLGHSSIVTTALYLHIARKNINSIQSPLDLLYASNFKQFQ